jgi:hypothetical protein
MDTIQRFRILLQVALLAGGIKLQGKIALTAGYHLWMWKARYIGMAIHTRHIFLPMHRGFESLWIDRNWKRLIPDLSGHPFLLMTPQTRFVCGLLTLE